MNKEKIKQYQKQYREANSELIKAKKKAYREIHKNRLNNKSKLYREQNKEQVSSVKKAWKQRNVGKVNASNAKRRASKLNATPKWLTQHHINQIKSLYCLANTLTKLTKIQYHVDHIYPLQGKSLSGLHVPWNLRIITSTENLQKGTKLLIS